MNFSSDIPSTLKFRTLAAAEAVESLGLLKKDASGTIEKLLIAAEQGMHPKAVCTKYRKEGIQVENAKKKALGVRANAFLSEESLSEISEKGHENPLEAHYLTLLRASFAMFRHRNALSAIRFMANDPTVTATVEFDVFHPDSCSFCLTLNGEEVGSDFDLLPRPQCDCITAPYGIRLKVDFLSGLSAEPVTDTHQATRFGFLDSLKSFFRL